MVMEGLSADAAGRRVEWRSSRAGAGQYIENTATCCRRCTSSVPFWALSTRNSTEAQAEAKSVSFQLQWDSLTHLSVTVEWASYELDTIADQGDQTELNIKQRFSWF